MVGVLGIGVPGSCFAWFELQIWEFAGFVVPSLSLALNPKSLGFRGLEFIVPLK